MPQAAPAGTFCADPESGSAQTLVETGVVVLAPDGKDSSGFKGCAYVVNGPAAVQGVIALVGAGVGAFVEVEDDGVKALRFAFDGGFAHAVGDIGNLNGYPWVGGGRIGEFCQGAAAPLQNHRVQFGNHDLCGGGKSIESRLEGVPHPQTSNEDPGARMIFQVVAAQLSKNDLGSIGQAVHKDKRVDRNQKVALATLTKLENPLVGGDALEYFPGLGHVLKPCDGVKEADGLVSENDEKNIMPYLGALAHKKHRKNGLLSGG